jgi:hypothetical protein
LDVPTASPNTLYGNPPGYSSLYLLQDITGSRAAHMHFQYLAGRGTPAVELAAVSYNPGSPGGCYTDRIQLNYRAVADRQTLQSVVVYGRASCAGGELPVHTYSFVE